MFDDKRSKKILFLAHCILNQNAKLDRCAHYPGTISEILDLIARQGIGIVQMPCPELLALGLDRQTDPAATPTIEQEDTRIYTRMQEDTARKICQTIADNVVYQITQYQKNGFDVVGLIGINGSPTCGVETTWKDGADARERGVFIDLLERRMAKMGCFVPMIGMRAYRMQEAIESVSRLIGCEAEG